MAKVKTTKWDHKACSGHFRHPAFSQRLCVFNQSEDEARAFADLIAGIIDQHKENRP